VDVHHDAIVPQHAARAQTLEAHGDLEDGGLLLQAHLQLALGLLHHFLGRFAKGFHLKDGHLLREVQDHLVDVRDTTAVHEGGCGGQAGKKAELEGFVDLLDVSAVEVEFHGVGFAARGAKARRMRSVLGLVFSATLCLCNEFPVLHFHGVQVDQGFHEFLQVVDAQLAGRVAKGLARIGMRFNEYAIHTSSNTSTRDRGHHVTVATRADRRSGCRTSGCCA
jgi:hypothetical protein